MSKKLKGPLTKKINYNAAEIVRNSPEISLDMKRRQFKDYLDKFYQNFSGTSELLVERLKEIEMLSVSYKDIAITVLLSFMTSLVFYVITYLLSIINLPSDINNHLLISKLHIIVFLMAIAVTITVTVVIHSMTYKKELSYYEQLHLSEYEIKVINDILTKRLSESVKQNDNRRIVVRKVKCCCNSHDKMQYKNCSGTVEMCRSLSEIVAI